MLTESFRLLGIAAFLATAIGLPLAALVLTYASWRGWRFVFRATLALTAAWLTVYGLALLASPLLVARTRLPLGGELSFCGVDCHLHVAATAVQLGRDLEVTLRLRSDAILAPEYPSFLRVRAIDDRGREYPPTGSLGGPLAAGETRTEQLRFALPSRACPRELQVSWSGWADYLMPGPQNMRAQLRRRLALEPVGTSTGDCAGGHRALRSSR